MAAPMVRLHITPLTPDLLSAILGQRLSELAQNISYHSIQSAPEHSFGYVELPAMEAEKIKKKLNGAILKGKKIKVEDARPLKRRHLETEEDAEIVESTARATSKRSKKDDDVLSGHELSPGRKVKRGWTEAKSQKVRSSKKDKKDKAAKPQATSKYTEKEELLFRTKVPPNKLPDQSVEKRAKKSKKAGDSDVVHEFENTTVTPSFLRNSKDTTSQPAAEYRDGEGWVDVEGTVVEQESVSASRKRKAAKLGLEIDVTRAQALTGNRPRKASPSPLVSEPAPSDTAEGAVDDTTSSGTSSSSESSDSDSASDNGSAVEEEIHSESAPTVSKPTPQDSVHPLEALFKKPRLPSIATDTLDGQSSQPTSALSSGRPKPALELTTSFSFFGDGGEDEDVEPEEQVHYQRTPHENDISHLLPPMPMTPFSSQDFRGRRIRSAAPTPDTADIRKSTGYGSLILGEDDPDDVLSEGEDAAGDVDASLQSHSQSQLQAQSLGMPQSEFEKRFWKERGENNRAWKARRRVVLKEKRQRENRAKRPRAF